MATNCYLAIDGFEGDSTNSRHFKELELSGFCFGGKQKEKAVAAGAGKEADKKATACDLMIVKKPDRCSPKLFSHYMSGANISGALLTVEKVSSTGDLHEAVFVELKDLTIISLSTSVEHDNATLESVGFHVDELKVRSTQEEKK